MISLYKNLVLFILFILLMFALRPFCYRRLKSNLHIDDK